MTTPPRPGQTYDVTCPHCGKAFTAAPLGGSSERNTGFKCPHCRLFVAWTAVEDDAGGAPGPAP